MSPLLSATLELIRLTFKGGRDPYPLDDEDLVMVNRDDADPKSPKDGSKRQSKKVCKPSFLADVLLIWFQT